MIKSRYLHTKNLGICLDQIILLKIVHMYFDDVGQEDQFNWENHEWSATGAAAAAGWLLLVAATSSFVLLQICLDYHL